MLQDNDDGSGYFHTKENVLVYGRYGQKADMAGHDNWHVGVSFCGLASLLLPAFAALTPGGIAGRIFTRTSTRCATAIWVAGR